MSSSCSGLPTWTIPNVKFRKNSKLSSKKSLSITSTSLRCRKRTVSETSISILAKQLRVFESAKRRSLSPTAGQQGTTEQLSPTPQESWTETKTCKHALMCIILLIKYNTINVVIIHE